MKTWIGRILFAFAIFTLGFGLGKDVERNRIQSAGVEMPAVPSDSAVGNRVIVYYLHTTFRCVTCNAIERIARETVEREFAPQIEAGAVEWQAINFQMNEALAKRFEVASSAIVVVKVVQGSPGDYRRLDEAWTLHDRPDQLSALLAGVIRGYLDEVEP